ncbi:hypothetical protein ACFL6N_07605, partial [Thermodesulfobacteriota bacterium]
LVGMHQVDKKLQRFRHLFDRFSAIVRFQTFEEDDIRALARQICETSIDEDGIRFIHQRGGGKFRRTMVWFSRAERLARNNDLDKITGANLRSIKNGGGTR